MIYCNKCHEEYENASDWVITNGIKTLTEKACPECGSTDYKEMIKCEKCGEYALSCQWYCHKCGNSMWIEM